MGDKLEPNEEMLMTIAAELGILSIFDHGQNEQASKETLSHEVESRKEAA